MSFGTDYLLKIETMSSEIPRPKELHFDPMMLASSSPKFVQY
ncbi:hypothetical protein [Bacillus pumilus]